MARLAAASAIVFLALACGGSAVQRNPTTSTPPDAYPQLPAPGATGRSFAGCAIFPATSEWNRDISADAVDPHSADYLAFMGAATLLVHPDFGGPYGQPVAVVPGTQARVPMVFLYNSQSDPGPYPYPLDVPIQAASDHHAVVVDKDACRLYETFQTARWGSGFSADSGALFDLDSGAPRPDGWTSATASGLPILPGLARFDEVALTGQVNHALAFTAGATAHFWVPPATHSAGSSTAPWAPPLGLRVRLKAAYDLSAVHGQALVVLRGLQRYGMFLTDTSGGSFWSVAGMQDSRWSVTDLDQLKVVPASAFEVVQLPALHAGN